MKHPAEDNILKLRAIEKVVEQVSDIALHHLFCFAGDQEWTHIPTPVAVKEYVPREYFLQFAARCGFANARRAADDDEVLHIAAPWPPRCRAKNRIELPISKSGTSKWLPGLACRVFSLEPSAPDSVSMESRGCPASSHGITNSTGIVIRGAMLISTPLSPRPRTAAVIRGPAATRCMPTPPPWDRP